MVDMRVRHNDMIDFTGVKRKTLAVPVVGALLQATVDKDPASVYLYAVATPGDFPGSPIKAKFHDVNILYLQIFFSR